MPTPTRPAWFFAAAGCLLTAVSFGARAPAPGDPAEQIETLPGFTVETVLRADAATNGSWINLAKDEKGRLLLGGQRGQPMTRLTLKDGKIVQNEVLKLPVTETMGILAAFDSLYIDGSAKVKDGVVVDPASKDKDAKAVFGLFRLRSASNDGNYDHVEFLREWEHGSGEHGAHGIVVGPDKKLYIVCGNFTGTPPDALPTSPHRNFQDDLALPRAEDGNGFGAGKKPPGGFVARMDPDGKNAELFASGQRNTYDIAFNADGELLGFDSDMEWDWGNPWYRPIRVFHAISGGDTGFREGSAKWPEYYADSLPAVVNIGIGCPTGVVFGYGAKFPAKYQKAYYILDWSYGRLIAVHLTPNGASYTATWENFVAPKALHADAGKTPLNLTDAVVGDDGSLYFTVGGRGTPAALFRVTYTGSDSTSPVDAHDTAGAEARDLRHKLEGFHNAANPQALEVAWPQMGNADRFIRYAARIAVERQPVDQWQSRALTEAQPEASLNALLALARVGAKETQPDLLKALAKFPMSALDENQQMEKVRVLEVSLYRQGKPEGELAKRIVDELDALYPAKSQSLNRELCQVLLAIDAPDAVAKTVKLLTSVPTQEEQVTYAMHLRTITTGWTPELRKEYFRWFLQDHQKAEHPKFVTQWFTDAGRPYADGSSFNNFVHHIHDDAVATLKPDEKAAMASVIDAYVAPAPRKTAKPAKARVVVKEWAVEDLEPLLPQVSKGRKFARGKLIFEEAQCLACHKFGNEGGAVGPDLTAVSSRFQRKDILESIILPSKVISEQYANTLVKLKKGEPVEGRVLEENDDKLIIQPNPLQPAKVEVKKADIASRNLSKTSPMPQNLVDTFTKEEILDMIAYIESGGRKDHPDFSK